MPYAVIRCFPWTRLHKHHPGLVLRLETTNVLVDMTYLLCVG